MICMKCMGSGWGMNIFVKLTQSIKKDLWIYVPCTDCKGKGVIDGQDFSGETSKEDKKG